jgi:photosystem II stability/assembly factor-like uncharacterized protein
MMSKVRTFFFVSVILCSYNDCRSQWHKVESDLNSIPTKDLYYSSLTFISTENGWLQGMNAIFHTENGGKNWERILLQATFSASFSTQSISFIDNNNGWILHADSLYTTTDGGRQWTAIHLPTSEFQRIHFHSTLQGIACTASSFYYTNDGGTTWNKSTVTGLANGSLAITNLQFTNQKSGWATALGPGFGNGVVFKTGDGGESWKVIRTAYEYNAVWGIDSMHIVAVGVNGIYRCGIVDVTFDGGATWKDTMIETFLKSVAFCDSANGVAVAGDSLLIETSDGGRTWQKIENIGHESSVSASATGNTLYIQTTKGDIYRYDRPTRTLYPPARWGKARRGYCRYVMTKHDGVARFSPARVSPAGRKTGALRNACGVFMTENVFPQQ